MKAPSRSWGRALVVPAALLVAACGTQTSTPEAGDDPTPSSSTTGATPSPTDTPTPTPSATASPAQTPDAADPVEPQRITFDGVPQGPPPALPYLAEDGQGGWSLVSPDGRTRPLDRAYDAFAPMGDGLVGTASVDDTTRAYLLDGDLHEVSDVPVRGGTIAATPDGAIVAWLGADGRPHVVEQGGAQEYDLNPVPDGDHVSAVISDGTTCKEGVEGQGCAVFVDSADATRAWSSVSHGIVDSVPGVKAIGDVTEHGLLGMTELRDAGSCWGRFTPWKRRATWETCDYTLVGYDPTGQRVLAGPAYLDGFGQGLAAVLDGRDGRVLAEWRCGRATALLDTRWEDEEHVLALAYQDARWALLRLDVTDGSVELATPPVSDRGDESPYVLPTT